MAKSSSSNTVTRSPEALAALRTRNIRTALVLGIITLAVTGSMFAFRFSHHLKPVPDASGYGSPYLPAR